MTIYRGSGGTGEARTDTDITEIRAIMMEAKGYRDEAQTAAAEVEIDLTAVNEARDDTEGFKNEAEGFAQDASDSADAAAASEVNSAASANSAGLSATNAAASETAAAASEANAADSETAAAASAAAALASETASATSETNAATSEDNAAASESAAAASEAAALASENAAATSETNAAASETAAAASAAAAAASFDGFDDRYLGAKSSDPTVDNDGNTLLVGALYWSTPAAEFRAWDGSAWQGFGGLPSQDGASGKFLYSDGSNASWENVPDPQPATPTDDGLVFGSTPSTAPQGGVAGPHGIKVSNQYYQRPYNLLLVSSYTGDYVTGTDTWAKTTALPIISQGYGGSLIGQPVYINGVFIGTYNSATAYSNAFEVRNDSITTPYQTIYPETSYISTPVVGANTSLGYGSNNDNGSLNVTIGYGAGSTITTGSNLTVVGYDAEPSSATATNEVTLGNADVTKTRLFGALAIEDATGTSGQFLKSTGASTAPEWASLATVATTGSYNDLSNKPAIPGAATPTDDGLVFGSTTSEFTAGVNKTGYYMSIVTSTPNRLEGYNSADYSNIANNWWSGFDVGDEVYMEVFVGNNRVAPGTIFLGVVTSAGSGGVLFISNPTSFTTSVAGDGEPPVYARVYFNGIGGNVSVGYGSSNDVGAQNTSIGYGTGSTITTGSNLTVVGYNAEPSSATATNEATLGNSDTTKTRLWGAIAVDDDTGTSGQVLTSNGTGSATWETPASAPVTSVNGYTGAVSLTASDVGAATSSDISTAIAALVDSAPATLDTLNELAAALGDDANFASTVTTALAAKAPLSNPTFTGTVTADYLVGDGSGITGIDSFPSQTGHSGEYLTTDGTNVSWAAVDALPDQTGNSGKYLTTDGSAASWAVLDTDANTTTKGLYEMANTISTTYAITAGNNAMSAGPITVTGSVTVPSGSVWTIV